MPSGKPSDMATPWFAQQTEHTHAKLMRQAMP